MIENEAAAAARKEKLIKAVEYPNTISQKDANFLAATEGYSFHYIFKSGEMAGIAWIEVSFNDRKIAEIKESVCNLYF